jgi:homocysteine S-methyltransferase
MTWSGPLPSALDAYLAGPGVVILDGGLGTELARRGLDVSGALWSAEALVRQPGAIEQLHLDYLRAGADVATTATYQASPAALRTRGLDDAASDALIRSAVALAARACRTFQEEAGNAAGRGRPLVLASVGPYGAALANGSEYRGHYGVDREALAAFHRPRLEALAGTAADLIACETLPCPEEAEVLLDLLAEHPALRATVSFSCRDDRRVSQGETFADCVALAASSPQVVAVGVNCTAPVHVEALVAAAAAVTHTPILAYPNSAETWDAAARCWRGAAAAEDLGVLARRWRDVGARLIGGCCRVGPEQIRQIREALLPA